MSDNIQNLEEVKSVVASNDQFSMKLYDVLRGKEGNLIISPFSVSGVMAMLSIGARGNTLQQIRSGLSFPLSSSLKLGYQAIIPALRSKDSLTLETANTVFVKKNFFVLPEFDEILQRSFHASIQKIDFSDRHGAARMINNWVEERTGDKIKDLINENMLSSLVLVNAIYAIYAIYFKGKWATEFDPELTQEKNFSVTASLTVKTPMMMMTGKFSWVHLKLLASTMVELPYEGDRIVMQVLLPEERHGLQEVEKKLMEHNVQEMFANESYEIEVKIQLPKFKLEQTIPLEEHLTTLGMTDMCTKNADFSGIDGTRGLYVSRALQKVFIEVNEGGTEAAAATMVKMDCESSAPSVTAPPPKQFLADHPFIFYMRDKTTGMLLFQGRVANPVQ